MATVTSYTQTQIDTLLNARSTPAQVATAIAAITKTSLGLGNVDNTSDVNKPVSTATTAAISAAVNALVNGAPGALNQLNELATALGNDASFAATVTNALALKAPLASPTFTGTVAGITAAMVGLGNVNNTADTAKPVSTAQAAADAAVQAAAVQRVNHTGTQPATTITGLATVATSGAKSDIGLANVDNTSDAAKPVSAAQQAVIDTKPDATLVTSIWRPVGSGAMPVFSTVTASGSLAGGTGVKRIHNGPNPLTALRVVYGNYITNTAEASTGYGTRTIVAASVEYPSGTFTPISFRGAPGGSYSAGFDITSDDIAVSIPSNTDFWIRTYETWTAGTNIPLQNMPNQLGQSSDLSATPTDKTQTAGNAGFQSVGITPIQILGRVPVTSRCLYVAGDSITTGTGDNFDYSRGYVTMATDGIVDVQKVSAPSIRAQGDAIASGRWRKSRLMNGATAAYEAYGINDIANSRTLVQLQADKVNVWLWLAAAPGIRKVYSGTLVPYAPTSTDGWITASGQTISAYESVRTGFNSWIRDGAPLASTASLVAVAVGTGGALRAGQAGHPLTGYVDIAATVEVNSSNVLTLNGGFWKVPTDGRTVTDAAMSSGTRIITSATAAFTSADVGRVITVAGAGAAGALYIGGIASVQSGTQVTVNAPYSLAAGTTVSGATANIGKSWTQEGLHPGTMAHQAMAVALNTALPTMTA